MIVAEIEFRAVAVQMRFGNVVIGSDDPALQDREIIFDRVRMPESGADILFRRVVDGAVTGELAANLGITARCRSPALISRGRR